MTFLFCALVLAPFQDPADSPSNPVAGFKVHHFRVFLNTETTHSFNGNGVRQYLSMRPHGQMAVTIDRGGLRRVFDLQVGSRQEVYGDVPYADRVGNSGPFTFMRLESERGEKGDLERAAWTEDFRTFETGRSLPYLTLFDRPVEGFRSAGDLAKAENGYRLTAGDPKSRRAYALRPDKGRPFWSDPIEPFIADTDWVLQAMKAYAKGEPAEYQTVDAYGALTPIGLHFSGPEAVTFASWTKKLIRVDLERLNVRIQNLKYGGTVWIEENGALQLSAIEISGLLHGVNLTVRDSPDLKNAPFWPYFRHNRIMVRRKPIEPGGTPGASKGGGLR